jgi:hypothetical protein
LVGFNQTHRTECNLGTLALACPAAQSAESVIVVVFRRFGKRGENAAILAVSRSIGVDAELQQTSAFVRRERSAEACVPVLKFSSQAVAEGDAQRESRFLKRFSTVLVSFKTTVYRFQPRRETL